MEINWFPGHMAKSTREIEDNLRISDCVVYVLDSRAVRSCFNPNFDSMIRVPIVYVLNKADTCPVADTERWVNKLNSDGNTAVAVNGADSAYRKKLLSAIRAACSHVFERQRARGLNLHARAIVVGVPNTGKSTIINTLCNKARLITGNKAGVTRAAKWTRIDNSLDILDTPGTLYPKITDRIVGENLAILGSIKDEVIDTAELALALISRINAIDTELLKTRYGADITADVAGLEAIARSRGFKARGAEYDIDRAAAAVIDDYRKGRLGKISLEKAE